MMIIEAFTLEARSKEYQPQPSSSATTHAVFIFLQIAPPDQVSWLISPKYERVFLM
jgi:hypothetical protein